MSATPGRPAADEHLPYYAQYTDLVPDGDIVAILETQRAETLARLAQLSPAQALFRPTPADWNTREVLGHIIDGEQVFGYRALWVARGGGGPLPSFDPDVFVAAAQDAGRSIDALLDRYDAVRRASIALFAGFDAAAWDRRGIASDAVITTRALAYICAGHELHHIADFHARYGI